jgi:hypothetical protein
VGDLLRDVADVRFDGGLPPRRDAEGLADFDPADVLADVFFFATGDFLAAPGPGALRARPAAAPPALGEAFATRLAGFLLVGFLVVATGLHAHLTGKATLAPAPS